MTPTIGVPKRRAALGLILGTLLSLPVAYLFLQTHGPYEAALDRLVWGLDHHDYSRWAIFPALLILPGIRAFHRWQRAIPVLWMIYILGMFVHIFSNDEVWLFPRFAIDAGFIAEGFAAVAYLLMGVLLWTKEDTDHTH